MDPYLRARKITWFYFGAASYSYIRSLAKVLLEMAKRVREEEVDVGDIKDVSSELQIHGVLDNISPMKKGKSASYFDGEMTDGKGKMRIFGFDDTIRKRLSDATGSTIVLGNCQVKKARYSDEYEVSYTFRV